MEQAAQAVGETALGIQHTARTLLPAKEEAPHVGGFNTYEVGLALVVVLATLLLRAGVVWLLERIFLWRVHRSGQELNQRLFEAALRVISYLILLVGLYLALGSVHLPEKPIDWAGGIWKFYFSVVIAFFAMLLFRVVSIFVSLLTRPRAQIDSGIVDRQLAPLMRDLARLGIFVIAVILIVQTWGYDATALIAGVGLGGLAIAFAAQDTIANVFGSIVIYSDRPYKLGDWIRVSETEGIVEEIGIRSTRIRLFDKSIVSVPNKLVAQEKIHNFSKMTHRRIRQVLILRHDTPVENVKAALEAIRETVHKQPGIEEDTWAVGLTGISPSGQEVLLLAFTTITKWDEFLKIQEELLLSVRRNLESLGVTLAEPAVLQAPVK